MFRCEIGVDFVEDDVFTFKEKSKEVIRGEPEADYEREEGLFVACEFGESFCEVGSQDCEDKNDGEVYG